MNRVNRRQFIHSLAATVAAPHFLLASKKAKPLPISFSTLGCPKWDWTTILKQAFQSGYSAIELRGIQGEMDLPKSPVFAEGKIKQCLLDLEALDLRIINLGASSKLHGVEPAERAVQLDEARRFIDLAHRLKSPHVRVFPDRYIEGQSRAATIERIIAGLRELGEYAKESGVTVILESHGDFNDSASLVQIMKGAGMPTVALLWDTHHTVVSGKEEPEFTFQQLKPYVRHTHLKDSITSGKEERYVLTGSGTVPVRKIVNALVTGGYTGYFSFEWEKVWHPEIDEPEVAIPHYAKVMREYLVEAGYKA